MFDAPPISETARQGHAVYEAFMERNRQVEARIGELMGVINAAEGELVQLTAAVLDEQLGVGPGVHTPAGYLAWRTGLSPAHARDLVRIASRRHELPLCVAALADGAITIDQAAVIAQHVPANYDKDATEVGARMTVQQLRRTLPRYGYDPCDPPAPVGEPEPGAEHPGETDGSAESNGDEPSANGQDLSGGEGETVGGGADAENGAGEAGPPPRPPEPQRPAPERSASMGTDLDRWFARLVLDPDEGVVVERAARAILDDLWRAHRANPDADPDDAPTLADAFVVMAERALQTSAALHPGTDRYLVHLHVEQGLAGNVVVAPHLGTPFSRAVSRLLTCDSKLRAVVESGGLPIGIGRTSQAIPRRLRRLVEHRDGGCAVPGCGTTAGLQIHHIWHWEDGGPTEAHNLLCLCRRHHRQHHLHQLAITGSPHQAPGTPGCVQFRDRYGRLLDAVGTPLPLSASRPPTPPPLPVAEAESPPGPAPEFPVRSTTEPSPSPGPTVTAGASPAEHLPPLTYDQRSGPSAQPPTDQPPPESPRVGSPHDVSAAAESLSAERLAGPNSDGSPPGEPLMPSEHPTAEPSPSESPAVEHPAAKPPPSAPELPLSLADAARARHVPTPTYASPLGERVNWLDFFLCPRLDQPVPPPDPAPDPWIDRLRSGPGDGPPPLGLTTLTPGEPPRLGAPGRPPESDDPDVGERRAG